MDLSILISNFIIQLKILINHKNDLMSLYLSISKSKEAGTLKFKLINYNKWLSKLNDIKNSNLDMQINDDKDIKSLKLTSGLEKKIINYYHNNKIDDIEETVSLINNIKTENGISDDKDNMIRYNDNVNNANLGSNFRLYFRNYYVYACRKSGYEYFSKRRFTVFLYESVC